MQILEWLLIRIRYLSVYSGDVSLQGALLSCGPAGLPARLMRSLRDSGYVKNFSNLGSWNCGSASGGALLGPPGSPT